MKQNNEAVERYRVRGGRMGSDPSYGNNGAFVISCPATRRKLSIVASDQEGWEHVSVHISNRPNDTPTWVEMSFAKELFWQDEEWVVQYHPAKSAYVNCHPGTLHLWKPLNETIPTPPTDMV